MSDGDLLLLVELGGPQFMVRFIWAMQILSYPPLRLARWEDATDHLKSIRRTAAYGD